MKKLIVLACALSLGACASVPVAHPVAYAPPPAPVAPAPTVTVVPAAPVQPGTFKMRWDAVKRGAHNFRSHVHFFHKKKAGN